MELIKRLEPLLLLLLMVVGAVNWLLIGLFDTNVVTEVFGGGTVVRRGLCADRHRRRSSTCRGFFEDLGHMGGHDVRAAPGA